MVLLSTPVGRLLLSLVLLAAILPIVVWFFRGTWVELETDAAVIRAERSGRALDTRIPVTFGLGALSLLLINYYGSHDFYDGTIQPFLEAYAGTHPGSVDVYTYKDLYWRVYWGLSRYACYLLPIGVWPLVFKESPLDLGLRFRGFREHAWIYLLCLVVVLPVLRGPEGVEVVEQTESLVLFDIETGQAHQAPRKLVGDGLVNQFHTVLVHVLELLHFILVAQQTMQV